MWVMTQKIESILIVFVTVTLPKRAEALGQGCWYVEVNQMMSETVRKMAFMTNGGLKYLMPTVLLAGGFAVMTTSAMSAGVSDTGTALSTARIIKGIDLNNTTDLAFGSVIPTGTAGTVKIDPDGGARTATNVDVLVGGGPLRSFGAANFQVAGEPNLNYSILPIQNIMIKSGTNEMLVEIFTNKQTNAGVLNVLGADSFTVGATLNVGANQAAGTYSEQFSVTVVYD